MAQKITLGGLHELSKNVAYKWQNFQFLKAQPFQLEMAIFDNKISHKLENHSQISQNIWYFHEIKSSWKLKISFCYFHKNMAVILSVVHNGPV